VANNPKEYNLGIYVGEIGLEVIEYAKREEKSTGRTTGPNTLAREILERRTQANFHLWLDLHSEIKK
jgi:hypothetical protein